MVRTLSILGPTAVGKSAFSFAVAHQLLERGIARAVHVLSADSRQVFAGLEVLTGAEVPEVFQQHDSPFPFRCFRHATAEIFLHGVSILSPAQEWSVTQFGMLARAVSQVLESDEVLLVVGGTGLYQLKAFSQDEQLSVPPDENVRARAATASVSELQAWLRAESVAAFEQLNQSDRYNPRRLVRAIEVARSGFKPSVLIQPQSTCMCPGEVSIGLRDSLDALRERIRERVQQRFSGGAQAEVARLLDSEQALSKQARSTLGLRELAAFAAGEVDRQTALDSWARREFQYAKRQLTWWRKHQPSKWYSVGDVGWYQRALDFSLTSFGSTGKKS